MIALHAAELLGLDEDEQHACAAEITRIGLESAGDDRVLQRLRQDLPSLAENLPAMMRASLE